MKKNLIQKYNVPGPRYTSYPTVPYWDDSTFTADNWKQTVLKSFDESNDTQGVSIYIHLPFCEKLCTFCACHKRIKKQHDVEEPYVEALLNEWKMYRNLLGQVKIKELHLGGGTPTFFSPDNLEKLLTHIFSTAMIDNNAEFSFEGHPNNTTRQHLETLYQLGFRRVSFGVQDYDDRVQQAINRVQPFENVARVSHEAREIGYTSVSHDLIFGLPFQTWESVCNTIEKTKLLMPDRIAFYSYAHVPWIKGVGQRKFDEHDLPSAELKRLIYENSKLKFGEYGYTEIGMDHFSLSSDSLYTAMLNGKLHRNFMGYTSSHTRLMIGLGMSAISDSWYAFAQNDKTVEGYMQQVNEGILPVFRGHLLTEEDLVIRKHILDIMCNFETYFDNNKLSSDEINAIEKRLEEMCNDDLITMTDGHIQVTEAGRPFVRNIAMAFDLRLLRYQPDTRIFSMTI